MTENEKLFCPKCGCQQNRSERCINCGILFSNYFENKGSGDENRITNTQQIASIEFTQSSSAPEDVIQGILKCAKRMGEEEGFSIDEDVVLDELKDAKAKADKQGKPITEYLRNELYFDKVIEEYEKGQSKTRTQESDSKQSSTDATAQHDFSKPSQDNPGVKIITIIMLLLLSWFLYSISESCKKVGEELIRTSNH